MEQRWQEGMSESGAKNRMNERGMSREDDRADATPK